MTRRTSPQLNVRDAERCGSVGEGALSQEAANELAHLLGALSDPVRLRLLSMIASSGAVCSCDLEEPLGKSQPTVSHHTKVLADAGLIVGEKRGRWTWWHVVPERLATIASIVRDPRVLA